MSADVAVVRVDAKVIEDRLGCVRCWNDSDDFQVAFARVTLEDVDGTYALEEF